MYTFIQTDGAWHQLIVTCSCIYMYYVWMYSCMYIHIYIYLCVDFYTHAYIFVYICICTYAFICMLVRGLWTEVPVSMYMNVSWHTYAYMHKSWRQHLWQYRQNCCQYLWHPQLLFKLAATCAYKWVIY